ncbi:MAG TPA: nucleoside-diphosphate kinase [Tetragenococcus sp.]|nr:nucleoside-diphosphate kinase [Tetragenococcus sp.]
MKENTLVIIKPDGIKRKLVGRILQRFEDKQLDIVKMSFTSLTESDLKEHYQHLVKESFFPDLLAYMLSGPVILLVFEGENAVSKVRKMVGSTDPLEAQAGTIRADFALNKTKNLIHASDSTDSAWTEINYFFNR